MTTLELYRTAVAADDAFSAALQAEGFTRWTWTWRDGTDALRRAHAAKLNADANLHAAYAQLNDQQGRTQMCSFEDFLETLSPVRSANARTALEMPSRLNSSAAIMPRYAIVEDRVAAGARVIETRRGPVLQNPDGSFLDAKNITRSGIEYAAFLGADDRYA